ncbi:hypothetical protein F4809DRAFT_636769 [Biscogniauxia mediterranea]|nr:hypothetical protein F4809DRAFT_636769 [Biscogniauxia mediterranea]
MPTRQSRNILDTKGLKGRKFVVKRRGVGIVCSVFAGAIQPGSQGIPTGDNSVPSPQKKFPDRLLVVNFEGALPELLDIAPFHPETPNLFKSSIRKS